MSESWRDAPIVGTPRKRPTEPGNEAWREAPVVGEVRAEEGPPWHSFMTGAGRTEFPDAPELGTSGPSVSPFSEEGMRMMGAYATSADPKQVQDIATKTLEGAEAKTDRYGNPMVTFEGQDYYVNKPGFSTADLFQLTAEAGAYAPAARFGAGGRALMGRMARTGVASGATSVGLDKTSEALGSEQGVDLGRAGTVAAGGALFEGLTPLAVKAWRGIFRNNRFFDPSKGKLTEVGREAAEDAGLDPNAMGDRLTREFAEEMRDATDPRHAAGLTQGKEFDIPYTRGQATGDFRQLAKEESTRHGAFGDDAGNVLREFDDLQQQRMQAGRARVQTQVGGGETNVARPAQAGETVAEGMRSRAGRLGQQIDEAYEAARNEDARLTAGSFKGLTRRLVRQIKDSFDIDPDINLNTVKALRNIARLERKVTGRAKGGRITGVAFREIEKERRKINNLINNARGSDRSALVQIKNALDEWVDESFDNALFSGNAEALEKMKNARRLRAKYGELFEPDNPRDAAGKVVQRIIQDETVTPEQVVNNVFGRNGLGQKETSTQILSRIKNIVGEESPDWRALKEAGWLRLSKDIGTDAVSPKKYANRLNKVLEENQSLMDTLYTPEEVQMFQRFRDDLMRTVTPEQATNPSKTAYTAGRLIREWMGRLGTMFTFSGSPIGGALFFTMKRAPQVMGKRAARQAVRGAPRNLPRAPGVVAGGTAATALGAGNIEPMETGGYGVYLDGTLIGGAKTKAEAQRMLRDRARPTQR